MYLLSQLNDQLLYLYILELDVDDDKLNDIFGASDESLDALPVANLSLTDRLSGSISGPELPISIPEDSVSNVGSYFKHSGLFGNSRASALSLDQQDLNRPKDALELKGFVLDALQPEPYVFF